MAKPRLRWRKSKPSTTFTNPDKAINYELVRGGSCYAIAAPNGRSGWFSYAVDNGLVKSTGGWNTSSKSMSEHEAKRFAYNKVCEYLDAEESGEKRTRTVEWHFDSGFVGAERTGIIHLSGGETDEEIEKEVLEDIWNRMGYSWKFIADKK